MNKHQPLVHALSRTFKNLSIRHQVENGSPFHANMDLRMNIVIEARGLRDATESEYRNKAILVDVTYVRGHTSGRPHADRQRGPKRISCFHF